VTAPTRRLNRRLKSWPGWILMLLVAVTFLVVGATRTAGPQSQEDRVDDLTQRIACPVCDGESVFESQNAASRRLRNQVEDLVRQNELSDAQILTLIDTRNEGDLLLVPKASGLDALVWVLPAVGFVVGVTGLGLAFRRWRLEADGLADPTAADRELVEAALAADDAASEVSDRSDVEADG
jgi:cytochrome c-type biogenesis protein CcmH